MIYKEFRNKLYLATDFIVNYCCSSCGECIMDINKLFCIACTAYANLYSRKASSIHSPRSGAESTTSASSVNTRLSATAAEVKVTAVASCSHMLILQRGPHTQHTTHDAHTKSSGRPLISVAHCHGGAISHMLPANLPPRKPASQTWSELWHQHMNGFTPEWTIEGTVPFISFVKYKCWSKVISPYLTVVPLSSFKVKNCFSTLSDSSFCISSFQLHIIDILRHCK